MSAPGATPWAVIKSPNDAEMSAVQGAYLVADCLPIEDAHLIAASPALYDALEACHETMHECTAVLTASDCAKVAAVMQTARAALALARGEAA